MCYSVTRYTLCLVHTGMGLIVFDRKFYAYFVHSKNQAILLVVSTIGFQELTHILVCPLELTVGLGVYLDMRLTHTSNFSIKFPHSRDVNWLPSHLQCLRNPIMSEYMGEDEFSSFKG